MILIPHCVNQNQSNLLRTRTQKGKKIKKIRIRLRFLTVRKIRMAESRGRDPTPEKR